MNADSGSRAIVNAPVVMRRSTVNSLIYLLSFTGLIAHKWGLFLSTYAHSLTYVMAFGTKVGPCGSLAVDCAQQQLLWRLIGEVVSGDRRARAMRGGDGRLGHVLRHTVRAAQRRVLTLGPRPLPTVLFGSEAATGLRRRHVGSSAASGRGAAARAALQHPCCWPGWRPIGPAAAALQQQAADRRSALDRL
jgi:hypothetical protein